MQITFNEYEEESTYEFIIDVCDEFNKANKPRENDACPPPVDPEEVLSPHTDVVEFPAPEMTATEIVERNEAASGPTAKDIAREILDTPIIPIPPAPTIDGVPLVDGDPVLIAAPRDKAGDGVTWDARIHSGSKKMTTKGIWKRRKNIDDSLFESVMAELQGEVTTAAQVFDPAPVVVVDPSVPPPAPVSTGVEWGNVFQRTMQGVSSEQLSMEQVNAACVEIGVADFSALAGRSDLWDMFLIKLGVA